MPTQVFHGFLARVGDHHTYQQLMTVFCAALYHQAAITEQMNAFLFYQSEYQCPSGVENCQAFVCSLPENQQLKYIDPDSSSLVDSLGNYRCNGEALVWAQIIIYIGGILGALVSILLLGFFTQRQIVIAALSLGIIGIVVTLTSNSLTLSTLGIFTAFFGRRIGAELAMTLMSQNAGQSIRVRCQTIVAISFPIGTSICALSYWLIKPWQLSMLITQLIPLVSLLIVAVLFIQEVPFQLVTRFSSETALSGFQKIARLNGVECNITEEELARAAQDYRSNADSHQQKRVTVTDMCCYRSLVWVTVICIVLRFGYGYLTAASRLMIRDYSFNLYLAGIVTDIPNLFSGMVGLFLFSKLPRKPTIMVCCTASALVSGLIAIFASCSDDSCSSGERVMQAVGFVAFKTFLCFSYNLFMIACTEVFPSQLKAISIQAMSLVSATSTVVIPPVQSFLEANHVSVFLTFSLISLLIALISFGFKQTFNIQPPQMIEQLQKETEQGQRIEETDLN